MPYTDIGNQSTWVPGGALRQRRRPLGLPPGSEGVNAARQQAFAAEGLRRRGAMRAAGVPGLPAPSPTLGGMANVPAGGMLNQPLTPLSESPTAAPQAGDSLPLGYSPAFPKPPGTAYGHYQPSTELSVQPQLTAIRAGQESRLNREAAARASLPMRAFQADADQRMSQSQDRLNAMRSTNFNMPSVPVGPQNIPGYLQRAGEALDGNLPVQIPLEQQGFVDAQNRQPVAPITFAPTAEGQIRPGNPWYKPPTQLPTRPMLRQYGNSTVRQIGGRNVLVGSNAKQDLNGAGGVSGAIRRASDAMAARNADGEPANPQMAANISFLRKQAADREQRLAAGQSRLTGSPIAPKNSGGGGVPQLSLAQRQQLLDPENQQSLHKATGMRPGSDSPEQLLTNSISQLNSIDPADTEGRSAILQGVQAALSDPGLAGRSWFGSKDKAKQAISELQALVKNPDGYLSQRRKVRQPTIAAPSAPATRGPMAYGNNPYGAWMGLENAFTLPSWMRFQ